MKDKEIRDPFYQKIQAEIGRVQKKANTYSWLFYAIRIFQIGFGGLITVLAGLKRNEEYCILILGAITTAITAVDTLFQLDAKRNTYKLMLFELRAIRTDLVLITLKGHTPVHEIPQIEKNELMNRYKKTIDYARDLYAKDNESEGK